MAVVTGRQTGDEIDRNLAQLRHIPTSTVSPPAPNSPLALLQDPDFPKLTPQEQAWVRRRVWEATMGDPDFIQLSPAEKRYVRENVIGAGKAASTTATPEQDALTTGSLREDLKQATGQKHLPLGPWDILDPSVLLQPETLAMMAVPIPLRRGLSGALPHGIPQPRYTPEALTDPMLDDLVRSRQPQSRGPISTPTGQQVPVPPQVGITDLARQAQPQVLTGPTGTFFKDPASTYRDPSALLKGEWVGPGTDFAEISKSKIQSQYTRPGFLQTAEERISQRVPLQSAEEMVAKQPLPPVFREQKRIMPQPSPLVQESFQKEFANIDFNLPKGVDPISPPPVPPTKAPASLGRVAGDDLYTPVFTPTAQKMTTHAAKDFYKDYPDLVDPAKNATQNIFEAYAQGYLNPTWFTERGINLDTFLADFLKTSNVSARNLAYLNIFSKSHRLNKDAKVNMSKLGQDIEDALSAGSLWRRATNIWRGLLVTQLGTAVRNFETQQMRVGLDVLEAPLDVAIQKITGRPQLTHPADGLAEMTSIWRQTKPSGYTQMGEDFEAVLKEFPLQKQRLLMNYLSEVTAHAKHAGVKLPKAMEVLDKADEVVDILNTANRFQEWITRKGVFMSRLDVNLRNKGLSLEEIIKSNDMKSISLPDIEDAVHKALDVTWAQNPKHGGVAYHFVNLVNKTPLVFMETFPRFMVNSLKFLFDYSPAGMLKYLTKEQRDQFAKGEVGQVSKSILGTAMFTAAWEFRNSPYSGEKYYEFCPGGQKDAGGRCMSKPVDLRPFNPFVAHLFVADLIKRSKEGTLANLDPKDIAIGILGSSLRAGTGFFMLDQALDAIFVGGTMDSGEKVARRAKEFFGEIVGGLMTPAQQLKDLLAEFDSTMRIVRERKAQPFAGPTTVRTPFATDLPPAAIPTRTGPLTQEHPFLEKQLLGIAQRNEKTRIEAEADRLGFSRQEISPTSGDPDFDYRVNSWMGPMVDQGLSPLVNSEAYLNLTNKQKAEVLRNAMAPIRDEARDLAQIPLTATELWKRKLESYPRRKRLMIEELLEINRARQAR